MEEIDFFGIKIGGNKNRNPSGIKKLETITYTIHRNELLTKLGIKEIPTYVAYDYKTNKLTIKVKTNG